MELPHINSINWRRGAGVENAGYIDLGEAIKT